MRDRTVTLKAEEASNSDEHAPSRGGHRRGNGTLAAAAPATSLSSAAIGVLRRFAPGTTTRIATRLHVPAGLADGAYTLSLWMPDADGRIAADPRFAIQLANDGVWNAASGENTLTDALSIEAAAPGAASAATGFAVVP